MRSERTALSAYEPLLRILEEANGSSSTYLGDRNGRLKPARTGSRAPCPAT